MALKVLSRQSKNFWALNETCPPFWLIGVIWNKKPKVFKEDDSDILRLCDG